MTKCDNYEKCRWRFCGDCVKQNNVATCYMCPSVRLEERYCPQCRWLKDEVHVCSECMGLHKYSSMLLKCSVQGCKRHYCLHCAVKVGEDKSYLNVWGRKEAAICRVGWVEGKVSTVRCACCCGDGNCMCVKRQRRLIDEEEMRLEEEDMRRSGNGTPSEDCLYQGECYAPFAHPAKEWLYE